MGVLEWIGLAASIIRLTESLAAPVFASMSIHAWVKGDKQQAILMVAWAILMNSSGRTA
jgi:hypothetical protein